MKREELLAQALERTTELERLQQQIDDEVRRGQLPLAPAVQRSVDGFRQAAQEAVRHTRLLTDQSEEATIRSRNKQLEKLQGQGTTVLDQLRRTKPPEKLKESRAIDVTGEDLETEVRRWLDVLRDDIQRLCDLEEPSDELALEINGIRDEVAKFNTAAQRLLTFAPQAPEQQRPEIEQRLRQGIKEASAYHDRVLEVEGSYEKPQYPPAPPSLTAVQPADTGEVPPRAQAVVMRRAESRRTSDQPLWSAIRNRTSAIAFNPYRTFIDQVMCFEGFPKEKQTLHEQHDFELRLPFLRADAYTRLKVATELFMMQECGIYIEDRQRWDFREPPYRRRPFENKPDFDTSPTGEGDRRRLFDQAEEAGRLGRDVPTDVTGPQLTDELRSRYLIKLSKEQHMLPYFGIIREKLKELPLKGRDVVPPNCYGILKSQLTGPCLLELIWSFWHEAGFLVRTMQVINRRFQNIRGGDRDPLTRFDLDTLRPLGNLLWGHISDEQHRLTIQRRVYEYDHHYGLRLQNRPGALHPADSRSKFIAGFHNLLYLTSVFYKEDDDTTVIADAFRVLNALREVHLLLAEGAHNQFGDLPWTARAEMLMEQWLLARPEMREFLGGRIAVPYPEPWMDRVDTMKNLQNWTDVTITHFHDLAVCGEQILLSVRYGNWSVVNFGPQAANWARYWRPEIQRYIHAYQAVTGVDLAIEPVDTTSPAELLRQRALAPR